MNNLLKLYKRLGWLAYYCITPIRWLLISRRVRAYVVVEYDSRMLVVQNWLGKGEWSFPGGGAKGRETALQAAIREVKEEVGIDLAPASLKFLKEGFKKEGIRGKHYTLYHVLLHHQPSININQLELTEVRWEPATSLSQLALCYESKHALDAIKPTE